MRRAARALLPAQRAARALLPAQRAARALVAVAAALAAVAVVPAATPSPRLTASSAEGMWLAGDLHVHTTYSHDSYGGPGDDNTGPDEAYTLGHPVASQFAIASARGLDFIAITDHNDVRSQTDPGWSSSGILGIPGYENSLHGHAQMLGADHVYDNGDRSAAAVQALADQLRADGGVFQANHPALNTIDPDQPDWEYGYDVQPHTVEVWNISPLWKPPAPSGTTIDLAIAYWEGWLDRGAHVGATGGSDNHYVATAAVQGVGQPTTWVFASAKSQSAILEGLRLGRTTISHQPPGHRGPRAFLEADSDGNGAFDAMMGDTVPSDASFRIVVEGAPGSMVRLFATGGALLAEVPVTAAEFIHAFGVPAGTTWVRAEVVEPDGASARASVCDPIVGGETSYCRDRVSLLALTSPIYVGAAPST